MTDSLTPTAVDWDELDHRLRPNFMQHVLLLRQSLSYTCIRQAYAHTIPDAMTYASAMLGCDPKHRYEAWLPEILIAYRTLGACGVTGYLDLVERIATPRGVEDLLSQAHLPVGQFAGLMYFLRYWVIPPYHPTRELLDPDDAVGKPYLELLKSGGIVTSLDLLENGRTAQGRTNLAEKFDLPLEWVTGLVHRADMRRLPYHSRKTISHLVHAGAGSLAALAAIDPQVLVEQVLTYGQTIGKDLHYGIEPANSALIARILPSIVA